MKVGVQLDEQARWHLDLLAVDINEKVHFLLGREIFVCQDRDRRFVLVKPVSFPCRGVPIEPVLTVDDPG